MNIFTMDLVDKHLVQQQQEQQLNNDKSKIDTHVFVKSN